MPTTNGDFAPRLRLPSPAIELTGRATVMLPMASVPPNAPAALPPALCRLAEPALALSLAACAASGSVFSDQGPKQGGGRGAFA